MSDIFISYSKEDRGKAKDIAEALKQQGFSVWWDRSILPGETFDTVIEAALDAAKCVIVLWSRTSVSSKWVKTEASEGDRRGIIIPVLIERDVKIPLAFRRIQAADLKDWVGKLPHLGFDRLLKAVAGILGRPLPVQPGRKTNEVRDIEPEKVHILIEDSKQGYKTVAIISLIIAGFAGAIIALSRISSEFFLNVTALIVAAGMVLLFGFVIYGDIEIKYTEKINETYRKYPKKSRELYDGLNKVKMDLEAEVNIPGIFGLLKRWLYEKSYERIKKKIEEGLSECGYDE